MRRYDPRLWLGGLLILGGLLGLLDRFNIISSVGDVFWGLIFGAVAVYFLQRFFIQREGWAIFPGFILLGLAVSRLLPDSLDAFSGLVFFAGIGIAFLWVYIDDRTRWWAIIPAGVMFTLGTVSLLSDLSGGDTGGYFFIGLGLTFILVTILPGGGSRSWAMIPGVLLLVFGALIGSPLGNVSQYIVPTLLILLGIYVLTRVFTRQQV